MNEDDFPVFGCNYPGYGEIWPVIVFGIIVFLVWTENGTQNCNGKWCNHSAFEKYKNVKSENSKIVIDKTISAVRTNHTLIGWRRALLVSLLIAIIVTGIFCQKVVHGFVFTMVTIILFIGIYFSSAWFQFRWWKPNDNKIERALKSLRSRI